MWSNFDGKPYTREQWLKHVASLNLSECGWIRFITLHNTSSPTIAQWQAYPEQKRIMNLESYYEHSMGWHAGPHGFIPPDESINNKDGIVIFGFTNLNVRGVHASCFNFASLGFEMVGEFNVSPFDTPPGSYVRDNAVFVLASLYNRLNLSPEPYVYGARGLHFHIECRRDNHDCPGVHARNKPDLIARIKAKMAELKGSAPPPPPVYSHGNVEWAQDILNKHGAQPLLDVDGKLGPLTAAALKSFQAAHGLPVNGVLDAATVRALDGKAAAPFSLVSQPSPSIYPAVADVTMTEFAGPTDHMSDRINGYTGQVIDWHQPLVALPLHFPNSGHVLIKVTHRPTGKSVIAGLGDIGPWTTVVGQDQWVNTGARPRAESNKRTNGAGIDATPGMFQALGVPNSGKILVDVQRIQ